MENNNIGQDSNGGDVEVRRPYHAPQLTSLGEIQSIIQSGSAAGGDLTGATDAAS